MRILLLTAAAALSAAIATPAAATGKMTCNAPQKSWKTLGSLESKLKKDGWEVRKSKVDGGCYEVYGTDPQGRRVEAYFHPVSFKMLLSSRRGEVLYKAN
ncbi:PepSY domain-containing protein [Sphingomonas glaciei]|uniref:PepSY domain-containing protein n=1 Tax=Sphingomonas glaciei TaxID=2938948 RepID=A0ABY5MSQ0_9SPHN|nr:PepSY domain-containing protein [Sphingomonas glaciei]UUR06806.1 PepSY domain-containing protein [Sphingomonas glaciei]